MIVKGQLSQYYVADVNCSRIMMVKLYLNSRSQLGNGVGGWLLWVECEEREDGGPERELYT